MVRKVGGDPSRRNAGRKPRVYFDPEKEITTKMREIMVTELEKMIDTIKEKGVSAVNADDFLGLARNLVILFPERYKKLGLEKLEAKDMEKLQETAVFNEEKDMFRGRALNPAEKLAAVGRAALTLKIILPPEQFKLLYNDEKKKKYREQMEQLEKEGALQRDRYKVEGGPLHREKYKWTETSLARALFPDLHAEFSLYPPEKAQSRKAWQEHLESSRQHGWWTLLQDWSRKKLFSPEKPGKLSEDDWKSIKKEYEQKFAIPEKKKERTKWAFEIVARAASMKIIAAEKVEITDRGLGIVMPEEKKEK